MNLENTKIAVVGLGYVGLPLAVEFGKKYQVWGFDISHERIRELKQGDDKTKEVGIDELKQSKFLSFTANIDEIKTAQVFIVTVPTPIDKKNKPDLSPLISASKAVGGILKKDDVVIYESTVYPGTTEEICIPILENSSKLEINKDFYVGYSPERINPGDKNHKITDILKVTSGSNKASSDFIDQLYASIIPAGTFKATSIRVAEAAKVIENTQRDLNIALINELSHIFNKLDIDTYEVLEAAETKWNFLPFKPGLVGGHCIGVDPYYLTFKAQEMGYEPRVILAGRQINDEMAEYVSKNLIDMILSKNHILEKSKVLIMGFTFKEDCPDTRNTKIFDLYNFIESSGLKCDIYDPVADCEEVYKNYKIRLIENISKNKYEAILIAVPHKEFIKMRIKDIKMLLKPNGVIYDLKSIFDRKDSNLRL